MNNAELKALQRPLTNDARVLYMLGLRPGADEKTGKTKKINYRELLHLLNGSQDEGTYQRGRQINSLLKLLEQAGLLSLPADKDFEHTLNGVSLTLPLVVIDANAFERLHRHHEPMTKQWVPNHALYLEIAELLGIIDKHYDENDIGEFIAYWMGRPEAVFSLFQWTQKFTYAMRKKRLIDGYTLRRQVGHQHVSVEASVEADDNARKLVEKYNVSGSKK